MTDKPSSKPMLCSPLSPGAIVALSVGIGASLAVSLDPATGIALGGGIFVALWAARRRA